MTYLTLCRSVRVEKQNLVITNSTELFTNPFKLRRVKREDKSLFVMLQVGMELVSELKDSLGDSVYPCDGSRPAFIMTLYSIKEGGEH